MEKLLLLLIAGALTPSIAEQTTENSPVVKSKVCLQYMTDLQSSIADEGGEPILGSFAAAPTSVFCLLDYDIVKNSSRPELPQEKCSKVYRFLFDWSAEDMAGHIGRQFHGQTRATMNLDLLQSSLHVYMKPIQRHLLYGDKVNVSISMQVTNDSTTDSDEFLDDTFWTPLTTIDLADHTKRWLDLNVSSQLANSIWEWDSDSNRTIFDIALKFHVDCEQQKKVPLEIINPVVLNPGRNQRKIQTIFQPFLVISVDDTQVKEAIERKHLLSSLPEDPAIIGREYLERGKRSAYHDTVCHLTNFTANFTTLGIHTILKPIVVNVGQCRGSCSAKHAPENFPVINNHARLMVSAVSVHNNKTPLPKVPIEPCCTSIDYFPVYLMIWQPDTLTVRVALYDDFIAKSCACR